MNQPGFSAKEFQRLGEIMHDARSVNRSEGVWKLVSTVQHVIPYEFSGCGGGSSPWSRSGAWALDLSESSASSTWARDWRQTLPYTG